jgi:NTE family protein
LSHIGIIKVLEANNIPIDLIAGTSIGAVIGGMYASGLSIDAIEQLALDTDWRKLFFLVDPYLKQGLIGGEKIKTFIRKNIKAKKFDQCRIPFSAVATNLKNGEIVVLNKGDLAQAIRASISIPLAFKPVKMNGRLLADGFLSAPVPVDIVRKMGADIVIAVNIDKPPHDKKWKPGLTNIANNSLDILRYHLSRANSEKADLVVEIDLGKSPWFEFSNRDQKILSGEKAMKAVLPELRKIISKR